MEDTQAKVVRRRWMGIASLACGWGPYVVFSACSVGQDLLPTLYFAFDDLANGLGFVALTALPFAWLALVILAIVLGVWSLLAVEGASPVALRGGRVMGAMGIVGACVSLVPVILILMIFATMG
ncbi:MAG: hypothetical protein LKI25_03940 [Atopobiaceae bacterium]|jgi:hypothetical protein|nr:hypothetical protein [Atopobiaceae bacterium]MCI2173357.1 hypothetical protein [Atopobiaceae bacterium]MCI2207352.1 hypothetical protein [Atopobiaceae bacterium]